jgi:hypothetical protein
MLMRLRVARTALPGDALATKSKSYIYPAAALTDRPDEAA